MVTIILVLGQTTLTMIFLRLPHVIHKLAIFLEPLEKSSILLLRHYRCCSCQPLLIVPLAESHPMWLKEQIRHIGELGLTVNLSEMDVHISQLENPELRPLPQTQIYHDLVAAAIGNLLVVSFIVVVCCCLFL